MKGRQRVDVRVVALLNNKIIHSKLQGFPDYIRENSFVAHDLSKFRTQLPLVGTLQGTEITAAGGRIFITGENLKQHNRFQLELSGER